MILNKIRQRKIFLILMVGLALFAFVISGIFDQNNTQMPTAIGEVNGEEIPYSDFRMQVEQTQRNMGANSNISTNYIVNMLWQQAVQGKILDEQFEKLGIEIGKDQILNAVMQSPGIATDPQFLNSNGVFDPNKFAQFIADLKRNNPAGFAQWQLQEEQLAQSAKRQIYLTLIRSGLGATAAEGRDAYHQEADKVDIKYISLPYSGLSDEDFKISDSEIEKYIKEHQKEYTQKNTRNIQFVHLKEEPTAEDKQEIKDRLTALTQPIVRYNSTLQRNDTLLGFAGVSKRDMSNFVRENSDTPFDTLFVSKDKLPVAFADDIFNLNIGEIYGPYEDADSFKLTRMLDKTSNAEVRASHILISYKDAVSGVGGSTRTKEEAKTLAESILAKVKSGSDFAELARENSDDKSTSDGDLNFFTRGVMVKPFNDFVFSNSVGTTGLVETDFGFHIIKITEQKQGVQVATISKKIEPSEKTKKDIFERISKFEADVNKTPTKFSETAAAQSFSLLPANDLTSDADDIFGLGQNRGIVQWAFNEDTEIGDIRRFDLKDGVAVVQVTNKKKEGLAKVADVRPAIEPILIKQKKAEKLKEQIKGSTIDEIANATNQNNIRLGEGLTIKSPSIIGAGLEPKVVGVAFGLPLNKVSKPIVGENGVYVIEVTSKNIAPELPNYSTYTNTLRTLKTNRASTDLFSALEESAEIKDNRNLFY